MKILAKRTLLGAINGLLLFTLGSHAVRAQNGHDIEIELEGSWPGYPAGLAQGVAKQGDFLYGVFANAQFGGSGSLRIFDVHDPAKPALRGWAVTEGQARRVAASGNHAYVVSAGGGLEIFDVSDSSAPRKLGTLGFPSNSSSGQPVETLQIEISNGMAIVVAGDLYVVDVSDPARPLLVGSAEVGDAAGMAVAGSRVYVCGPYDFAIVDISEPAHPSVVSKTQITPENNVYCQAVAVAGNYAYLAGESLVIYDVANPAAPTKVGQAGAFGVVTDIVFSGNHVILSNGFIFDISIPSAPTQASGWFIDSRDLLITEKGAFAAGHPGLQIFKMNEAVPDFSQPIAMVGQPMGLAIAIAARDDNGFVLTYDVPFGKGVVALDIADPAQPVEVAKWSVAESTTDLAVSGDELLAGSVWDISDPALPTHSGPLWLAEMSAFSLSADYVYAIRGSSFHVLDRDRLPGAQDWDATVETSYHLRSLTVSGTYAFVLGYAEAPAVTIIDIADPKSPRVAGHFLTTVFGEAVAVNGPYCYVGGAGIEVIDISDLSAPVSLGVFLQAPDTGPAIDGYRQFQIVDGYLYALQNTKLVALDLSNPRAPARAAALPLSGPGQRFTVNGNTVLVTQHEAGVAIGRIVQTPPAEPRITSPILDRGAVLGNELILAAEAEGTGPLTYQWLKDGQPVVDGARISGSSGPALTISATIPSDAGQYTLVVQSPFGTAITGPATLKLLNPVQFESVTAWPGIPHDFPPGSFSDLEVKDQVAYVTTTARSWVSLQLFNVSNPDGPVRLGGLVGTGGSCLAVEGGLAFLGHYSPSTVSAIDVTDPTAPKEVGRYHVTDFAGGVDPVLALAARGALVCAATMSGTLEIIDFSNPGAPTLVAELDILGHGERKLLAMAGDFVCAQGQNGGLKIIDLSIPASPKVVGNYNPQSWVSSLWADGDLIWIGAADEMSFSGIEVIDISDPSAPVLLSSFETEPVRAISVSGRTAVVTTSAGFEIVDFGDFAMPELRSKTGLAGPGTDAGLSEVKLSGDIACFLRHGRTLEFFDLSDPASPRKRGSFQRAGGAAGVWAFGQNALVADWSAGLRVLDLSNPEAPKEVSTIATDRLPRYVLFSDSKAYFIDAGALKIVDLSEPSAPRLEQEIHPAGDEGREYVHFALYKNYALLSESGWEGRSKLRIANLADPSGSPAIDPNIEGYGVVVAGDYAFVSGGSEIKILDLSDPEMPWEVGSIQNESRGDFVVAGDYLYATHMSCRSFCGWLNIFNIEDPAAPSLLKSVDLAWPASAMHVVGDRLYIVESGGFSLPGPLEVLDISTPADPVVVSRFDLDGANFEMSALLGNTLLIADRDWGLRILRVAEEFSLRVGIAEDWIYPYLKVQSLQVRWQASPGRRYQVQSSESMERSSWVNEGEPTTASGSSLEVRSLIASGDGMRFYRVLLLD